MQAGKLGSIQLASLSALNGIGGFTGGCTGALNPAGKYKLLSKSFYQIRNKSMKNQR